MQNKGMYLNHLDWTPPHCISHLKTHQQAFGTEVLMENVGQLREKNRFFRNLCKTDFSVLFDDKLSIFITY